jgi:hypothetical protein
MINQFFKIGGVKNEKEFLAKYPTEASFFRQHPEAMSLVEQSMPYMPSYSDVIMPQAMYGMSMGYGGYIPMAANGMQVTEPPRQQDYPDYESFTAAFDQYLAGLQQQADTGQTMPQGSMNAAPAATGSPYVPTNKFNLKNYQGVSVVDFLMAQGKPADFAYRKQLASALGINNYRGTASQNKQMMQMIQQAPDILGEYEGPEQPTAAVRKTVAKTKNAMGAPSTQSIAQAKQEALIAPTSTSVDQSLQGQSYKSSFDILDQINTSKYIRRSLADGRWVPIPDPAGMMTTESARRKKLADDANMREALEKSNQPMFKQGYATGGEWNGTWNGNQGFQVGGSYLPDYASSAYGLPQFELGAPIYADGGMSPEEAMMMQQQGAAPQQGGGEMDQQQIVQAIAQMIQQGMDPNQIMQQLVQGGVPAQMAEQLVMMVMQQMQGGQEGMGDGQPNGAQQPMAPASPEQGMEGMQMPNGMAKGGMVPGWEGEVSMAQLEDLKRRGIKFDLI